MGLVLSILSLKIRFPVHCSVYFILEPTSSWKPYMSQESCDGSNMTVAEKQNRFETHNQKYNNIIIYIYVHSVIIIYKYNHILYKYNHILYKYIYMDIPSSPRILGSGDSLNPWRLPSAHAKGQSPRAACRDMICSK